MISPPVAAAGHGQLAYMPPTPTRRRRGPAAEMGGFARRHGGCGDDIDSYFHECLYRRRARGGPLRRGDEPWLMIEKEMAMRG